MDPFSLDHIFSFPFPMLSKNTCRGTLGQIRLELMTPALSEQCSNQLSYWPDKNKKGWEILRGREVG